ncbi:MAG: hypothetical protein DLM56_06370 [Pseudonocardiales bacterium]|nr:MAG: hypothetical protein DLM56_06370 [Pseudonocardiales bacterium]
MPLGERALEDPLPDLVVRDAVGRTDLCLRIGDAGRRVPPGRVGILHQRAPLAGAFWTGTARFGLACAQSAGSHTPSVNVTSLPLLTSTNEVIEEKCPAPVEAGAGRK